MLAVDTNLIVRYLTGDHPKQSAKARALIDGTDVFVTTTVVLETEWVLRSVYGYDPSQICVALCAFAGLPRVSLGDPALVATALDRTAQGLDFADALHLGRSEDCDAFVTFDQHFIGRASRGPQECAGALNADERMHAARRAERTDIAAASLV